MPTEADLRHVEPTVDTYLPRPVVKGVSTIDQARRRPFDPVPLRPQRLLDHQREKRRYPTNSTRPFAWTAIRRQQVR